MFIRIVKFRYSDKGTCSVEHEGLYECNRYLKSLVPTQDPTVEDTVETRDLMLVLESDSGHSIELVLERKHLSIYIMNDQGKTIDSFQYA